MTKISIGSCVQIPDGRLGRVRDIKGADYIVRVRRTKSETHQFITLHEADLMGISCPTGWMSPDGYNKYLKITLAKMKQRKAKKMKKEDKISLSEWNELTDEEKEKLRTWAINHRYELDLIPGSSGTFDPVCEYAALLTSGQMITYLREHNQKIPEYNQTVTIAESKKMDKQQCKRVWEQLVHCLRQPY